MKYTLSAKIRDRIIYPFIRGFLVMNTVVVINFGNVVPNVSIAFQTMILGHN